MTVRAFAPAKINLTLHVTGRRDDGYHLIDSLVVFADVGDWVIAAPSGSLSLTVTGPAADAVPVGADNLVMKAAGLMDATAELTLEKHLPTAAGIGGGSSDAAATLFALSEMTGIPVPRGRAATLGADVPVCLRATRSRMQGIGDVLHDAPNLPKLFAILVNPGVVLPTRDVFAALAKADNPPMPDMVDDFTDVQAVADWLRTQRNDLQAAAITCAPVIDDVLDAITATENCQFARMSGSGATCFGLYPDMEAAERAAAALKARHSDWWVMPTRLS